MNAPPRRRLTAEERRTGILDAALAVFSESGYHSASIDDIAREAGVSKALIYEHFASKQELYADLIARNARELTQRIGAGLVGVELESGSSRLAVGLDAFFAFVEERRDAWRMLFRDVADPETATVVNRMLEQVTAEVTVLISQDPGARALDNCSIQVHESFHLETWSTMMKSNNKVKNQQHNHCINNKSFVFTTTTTIKKKTSTHSAAVRE